MYTSNIFKQSSLLNSDQIISDAFSAVLKNDLLLHEAVIKNDAEAVEEVLKEPLDVNSRNNVSTHSHQRLSLRRLCDAGRVTSAQPIYKGAPKRYHYDTREKERGDAFISCTRFRHLFGLERSISLQQSKVGVTIGPSGFGLSI
jgi:hypothetical protein